MKRKEWIVVQAVMAVSLGWMLTDTHLLAQDVKAQRGPGRPIAIWLQVCTVGVGQDHGKSKSTISTTVRTLEGETGVATFSDHGGKVSLQARPALQSDGTVRVVLAVQFTIKEKDEAVTGQTQSTLDFKEGETTMIAKNTTTANKAQRQIILFVVTRVDHGK